jgi:hypothetical protein
MTGMVEAKKPFSFTLKEIDSFDVHYVSKKDIVFDLEDLSCNIIIRFYEIMVFTIVLVIPYILDSLVDHIRVGLEITIEEGTDLTQSVALAETETVLIKDLTVHTLLDGIVLEIVLEI